MKLITFVLGTLGVIGAAPLLTSEEGLDSQVLAAKTVEGAQLRYQLSVTGREGTCTVVKQGEPDAARAKLGLGQNCVQLLPRLADALYWEEESGQVNFAAADGQPIVEFFAADGVAYESLKPVSPLVMLVAQ